MKRNYAPETLPGGSYPEPPYVPGWDFCGVLDEAPDGGLIGIGEAVIGLALSPMGKVGAYAEYVVTEPRSVVRAEQRDNCGRVDTSDECAHRLRHA
jgi:NADPH:quinone reductase-like Zn-dependent oxidoreductase